MRPPARRERPSGAETLSKSFGGDRNSIGPTGADALWPRAQWDTYLAGRLDGYIEGESVGFARGYQACEDELSTLQREAHRVVLLMAGIDPHEVRQARRRQAQVEVAARHEAEAQPWPGEVAS